MKRATAREERERAAANRGLHAAPDLETSFMQRAATSRQRSAIFNAITGISGGGRILLRLSVNVRARTPTETSVFHEKKYTYTYVCGYKKNKAHTHTHTHMQKSDNRAQNDSVDALRLYWWNLIAMCCCVMSMN